VISAALETAPRTCHSTAAVKPRALLVIAPIALLTACGGGAPQSYAGMTAQSALHEAVDAATHDAQSPRDPLHGRKMQPERLVRSVNDVGEDAWVVVLDIGLGERACAWVWAEEEITRTTIHYFVDRCTQHVLSEPAEVEYG
jgi:hypothetical protein